MKSSKELIPAVIDSLKAKNENQEIKGILTGFHDLDRITGGFKEGQLIVLAGRQGMGVKSFLSSLLLKTAIDYNQPVAVFSLEDSNEAFFKRLIGIEARCNYSYLLHGKLDSYVLEKIEEKLINLSEASIYIDDTPSLSINEIRQKLLKLYSKCEIKLVIIDNLQLLLPDNRIERIDPSLISRHLKELAQKYKLTIIVVSGLPESNKSKENNKRPSLADLRNITTIDNYADLVVFLYRPEYYNIDKWDDEDRSITEDEAELIIGKNRNGNLTNIRLKFNGHFGVFDNH